MSWFKKKADPISDHARALNQQIAALESQIKKLDSKLHLPGGLKLTSTTLPSGITVPPPGQPAAVPNLTIVREPVFEEVHQPPIQAPDAPPPPPEMFNEFGGRKYDLPALWNRLRDYLRGPTTTNPRLVSYLAAGSFQGLRTMRHEKRVERRRFLTTVAILLFILFVIFCHYYRTH
jgi:hypothetical protein